MYRQTDRHKNVVDVYITGGRRNNKWEIQYKNISLGERGLPCYIFSYFAKSDIRLAIFPRSFLKREKWIEQAG